MKEPHTPATSDIATEPYKGTGVAVAAAGASFISHWVLAAVGLVGGAAASFAGYKQVNRLEEGLRSFHKNYSGPEHGTGMKFLATLADWTTRGSRFVVEETPGMKTLIKKMNVSEKRMEAMVFGGGLLGAFGFFVAPWAFAVRGGQQAHQGQLQFQRAQEEIRHLREALQKRESVAGGEPSVNPRPEDIQAPVTDAPPVALAASQRDTEIPKVKVTGSALDGKMHDAALTAHVAQ